MDDAIVTAIIMGFLVAGAGVIIYAFIASENSRAKRLREAKAAYDESLLRLKKNPTSPDLKQQTLALGRAYSNLTRDQKGVTVYDEVALANDISAACAAASTQQSVVSAATHEVRLARLAELKNKGLVTDEEYETERQRILREL